MRDVISTTQFKKDVKRMQKRQVDMTILRDVIHTLIQHGTLPRQYHPHKLSGDWDNIWECHLKGDWLLLYDVTETTVWLARTGTHSDLFG